VVHGELDWIVMKALEKDRARRYETANELAMDVERHLNCEPVVARPPSRFYEFQKTVRRHKFGFAAGAALIVVLTLGAFVSTWQAIRATQAEGLADDDQIHDGTGPVERRQAGGNEFDHGWRQLAGIRLQCQPGVIGSHQHPRKFDSGLNIFI
jgi:hypothetical protein